MSIEKCTAMVAHQHVAIKAFTQTELFLREGEADASLSIELLENATLKLFLVRSEVCAKEQEAKISINLAKNARLALYDIDIARANSRVNFNVALKASGAEVCYGGLHFLAHETCVTTDLLISHEADNTNSSQAFRGLYKDEACGSFFGRVNIGDRAANSSATQLYRAILLSENAKAFVRPQLEINNRHIKASHGASIGRLDEEALFYLCSRGFSKTQATTLLVTSLAAEILDSMGNGEIPAAISDAVKDKIARSMVEHHA